MKRRVSKSIGKEVWNVRGREGWREGGRVRGWTKGR